MKYDQYWYQNLVKSKFQPPSWVFAPVWTFLYICMFSALGIIIVSKFYLISILAYLFFIIQMGLNLMWTPVFFKQHNLRKAFGVALLLTIFVFLTMIVFFKISKIAGVLFFPYFLWCVFATFLTFHILELNE